MANKLIKNLFFRVQKCFLKSSATLSSTLPLPTSTTSSSFTVQYLVNSCGLSLDFALSVFQKCQLNEKNPQRTQSLADFLKSYHFSDKQVAELIVKYPKIGQCKVEDNLQPKFDYLVQNGFAGELLPQLIVRHPSVLRYSLDSRIKPSFEFLRSHLDSNKKIVKALVRSSWLLTSDLKVVMQPNIDILMKERMPAPILGKLITWQPSSVMQKPDQMVYAVNAVKNMGFKPTTPMFMHALKVMISMSESTWKKKIEVLKSMGWDEKEILVAFKREPKAFTCSEEKIKKAMDFYTNTMKLNRHCIISNPKFLMYAIEKRIRPRYNVLKVLESKKLIEGNKKIVWSLTINEKKFLKEYVEKYKDDVPSLLEMYLGAKDAKKIGA